MSKLTLSGEKDTDVVAFVHRDLILIIHVLFRYDLSTLNAFLLGKAILNFYIFILNILQNPAEFNRP
jgi:hypothetical protein